MPPPTPLPLQHRPHICTHTHTAKKAVEMAALLHEGEYVHARHLWRRSSTSTAVLSPLLEDWWNVTKGIICNDAAMIWQSLTKIVDVHPEPFKTYAQECCVAYRIRMLISHSLVELEFPSSSSSLSSGPKFSLCSHAVQSIYWNLLNFSNEQEFQDFCSVSNHQLLMAFMTALKRPNMPGNGHANVSISSNNLIQVVSFFESASKKGRIWQQNEIRCQHENNIIQYQKTTKRASIQARKPSVGSDGWYLRYTVNKPAMLITITNNWFYSCSATADCCHGVWDWRLRLRLSVTSLS